MESGKCLLQCWGTTDGGIPEWGIIELQGELEIRGEERLNGKFIGDLCNTKFGQPTLIIGHHILQGKEQKIEKPFAVLEKVEKPLEPNLQHNRLDHLNDTTTGLNDSVSSNLDNMSMNRTVFDTTIQIENKSKHQTEYIVKAIVKKKLVFKARPKPIIANVAKKI